MTELEEQLRERIKDRKLTKQDMEDYNAVTENLLRNAKSFSNRQHAWWKILHPSIAESEEWKHYFEDVNEALVAGHLTQILKEQK